MEFHVSHKSRIRYQFDLGMFSYNGNVIFANFQAAREFAQKINKVRMAEKDQEPVYAGLLNALGLIDEIMHALIDQYRREVKPDLNQGMYFWLQEKIGKQPLDEAIEAFCMEFPPLDVVQGKLTVKEYLSSENPDGKNNVYETLEEMLVLWVTNRNPAAMKPFGDLFDEKNLAATTAYAAMLDEIGAYCKKLPPIDGFSLVEFLRLPALRHPDSLFDQIEFIRVRWGSRLGSLLRKMLISLDWMREEAKEHGFGGPGPVEIPVYGDESTAGAQEYEAFSEDREWMPRLVLMAKNTYVWLDQLSKKYQRTIAKLNEIPDEELANLRDEGFTGLWLIGLWERSKASATIKQYCGNPEAIASAYSLADYRIADDLGGEWAYQELKQKSWRYGIRLASDMVPNHMGIDSSWVLYNPDRFLSLPYSPFPSYTFNGPNLSPDPNIGIFIEDHYFSREDASVVFQRVDYNTGDVRYIYHGNDGTSMPWNDTAQLNYLKADVRESVIQTILQVARRFPIIRFDAAMTLAKKHYQRLWFPEPGSGGDIATRSEYGMSKADFDALFPEEFWREVVDRVAVEAPDTLLLAEAFWLMEGYFVRTLGMHRVYNSAFMNLLRNEDNVQYRILLKSTLEYDPDILKRYVNFMNNPDEKTAVEQFGKGDKYFGICALMATMPGLPMFGHGQIEGFSEKYGMEYKRAYYDESTDMDLLHRHEREIFPLLHQRNRFAEVANFVLYNFATAYGNIDENVFAYSNFGEGHHTLVVYNNRFENTKGYVKQSVPFVIKQNGDKISCQKVLSESLQLHSDETYFTVLHDSIRDLNFVRPSAQICDEGLYFELDGYQHFVFNEVYEVQDDDQGTWRQLNAWLDGAGTMDLNDAIQELFLHEVLEPYRNCFNGNKLRWLHGKIGSELDEKQWQEIRNGTWIDFEKLFAAADGFFAQERATDNLFSVYCFGVAEFVTTPERKKIAGMASYNALLDSLQEQIVAHPALWNAVFMGLQQHLLIHYGFEPERKAPLVNLLDEWHLTKTQSRLLSDANWGELSVPDQIELIQWVYTTADTIRGWKLATLEHDLDQALDLYQTRQILKTNYYEGVEWFNKEAGDRFEILLRLLGYYANVFDDAGSADQRSLNLQLLNKAAALFHERAAESGYHYDQLFSEKPAEDPVDETEPTAAIDETTQAAQADQLPVAKKKTPAERKPAAEKKPAKPAGKKKL